MRVGLVLGSLACAAWASAANVLVMSSGDFSTDQAVVNALANQGHTATIGNDYTVLDENVDLSPYDVVYCQSNFNWSLGEMPPGGQILLNRFVAGGGGLIFSEWCTWKMFAGNLQGLIRLNPFVVTGSFTTATDGTFVEVTADPIVSPGVPTSFLVPLDSYSGTHTLVTAVRPGATAFYAFADSFGAYIGLGGRPFGRGRVAAFSTTNGPNQVANSSFERLLGNTVRWVDSGGAGAMVSGHVELEGWLASPSATEVEFVFSQGGETYFEAPFEVLDASGNFNLPVPLTGAYDVTVKGTHWLRRLHATSVTIGPGGVSGLSFSLINGDVDGSNLVDSDDFDRLVAGFGYALGDPSFDAMTDLNGTDNTDSDDFDILVANFGLGGD